MGSKVSGFEKGDMIVADVGSEYTHTLGYQGGRRERDGRQGSRRKSWIVSNVY